MRASTSAWDMVLAEGFTTKTWADALDVATKYKFAGVRSFVIQTLNKKAGIGYLVRIEMAKRCLVGKWIQPAYIGLCVREKGISVIEGRKLGIDVFAALSAIREQVRDRRSQSVDSDGAIHLGAPSRLYARELVEKHDALRVPKELLID